MTEEERIFNGRLFASEVPSWWRRRTGPTGSVSASARCSCLDVEVRTTGYYRRVRDLREDHDYTQREIAAIPGITQPQYFRYEQGYRDLPTDILIALANLYETSTDYILGLTQDPRPSRK